MNENWDHPSHDSSGDDTDDRQLGDVQQYLIAVLRRLDPESGWVFAWGEFYQFHNGVLRRSAKRLGVRAQDIDDCIQDVWAEVIQNLGKFEHQGHRGCLRFWLAKLVRSKGIDIIRRYIRHPTTRLGGLMHTSDEPIDPHADAAGEFEKVMDREIVHECLARFRAEEGEENYQIVSQHYWEGRTIREIAAKLGTGVKAVESRIHRLLRKLRKLINTYSGKVHDHPLDMPDRGR